MVTVSAQKIIAQPNRSATWRQNKLLIAALSVWCLLIATGFALAGAWVILPFAGIELLGVATGLYYVSWKLSHRHVISFEGSNLRIEKGVYFPKQIWNFPRDTLSISVERQAHPWDPLKIILCGPVEQVCVGEFLNKDDSNALLSSLRQQGVPVHNDSVSTELEI